MRKPLVVILAIILVGFSTSFAVEWNSRLGVGLRGPLFAPMVSGDKYQGADTSEPFMMGLGGSFEAKYGISRSWVVGFSVGYWMTYDDSTAGEDQSFKMYSNKNASTKVSSVPLSLTGQYYFIPESNVQPYLLFGLGLDLSSFENQGAIGGSYTSTDLYSKIGAGINFWIGESITFDISGRFNYLLTNLSNDLPENNTDLPISIRNTDMSNISTRPYLAMLEPSIGFTYFIGGAKDTDKDGIKDKVDQCPDTPKGALVDEFGCPLDADGDGVYDGLDTCNETPQGAIVDITGCALDGDIDGVPDGIDLCADSPLGVEVDVYGCPLDNDKDGIPDFKDQQLDTPLGAIVDQDGVAMDTDKDGVPDGIDKCPEDGEGIIVDEFGCPIAKPLTEMIRLNINYAAGSTEPDDAAKVILDDIAERMKIYSDVKIEINGYTDALGRSISNLKISERRAQAVMDYLESKGVPADRMKAQGFGENDKYFIDTNDTPEGRQKNRRVDIVPVTQ